MRLYRICHVRYLENHRGLGASYRFLPCRSGRRHRQHDVTMLA